MVSNYFMHVINLFKNGNHKITGFVHETPIKGSVFKSQMHHCIELLGKTLNNNNTSASMYKWVSASLMLGVTL